MIKCKWCKQIGEPVEVDQPFGKGRRKTFYCPMCGNEIFVRTQRKAKLIISEKQFKE